ncbi:hypothetical protein [Deinococcus humi]|uniref:DUF2834 domain-containing protein n=1 Tax=Deinococcus humi TaxID=662880 RepID=A0A7W8JZ39_9DEIO|nr:hypothetical protein [Deinococcus humi]MBB5365862.1 hypothetical protein [Deinococcus humi]GGO38881.1 hypothetical protein GCM10008949_46190 [Deinococcus humi]
MTWINTAPLVAGGATLLFAVVYSLSSGTSAKGKWAWPTLFCVLFFIFSFYAGLNEGATGFWPEHIRNLWGNQIWFDLLLAASVAIYLLVPKARALGINPLPWVVLTVATGSVGLLAFLAFVLWKQEHAARGAAA